MSAAPVPVFASPLVPASMFEGLFVRGLPANPAFHAALKRLGVDLARLSPQYPVEVWQEALATARRHFFAGHPQAKADWQLGRIFAQGFLDTMVGKVIAVTLPMLGTARLVERLPRHMAMGRPDMIVTVTQVGPTERRVNIEALYPLPDFMAGCLEVLMERTKAQPQVEVVARTDMSYVLRVRW